MKLRDYQQTAHDMLINWLANNDGNPCLELPTGAGKSHCIAYFCKYSLQAWPQTRILMLTHTKELIGQNAEKMLQHWPNAPLGVYSAGLGKRELGNSITFGGIQSLRNKAYLIGHIDIMLIDECHLVSHKEEGGYINLINDLKEINPNLRVIGYTATPYRLGHGLITDKPAIFDDLLKPVSIEKLILDGYLAPLKSKHTDTNLNTDGVKKRGGEFIEKELQQAVNTDDQNQRIVDECIDRAGDRKSWLFFCTGVDHALAVRDVLISRGIVAEAITAKTTKKNRENIIEQFKSGNIKALTNANVLTTGFDHPDLDFLAMLRPTMSTSLYVQMAGRGMRLKSHTDHCLVADFAGNVARHGPITNVIPPTKGKKSNEGPPMKPCPVCDELLLISCMLCPSCGHELEPNEKPPLVLNNDCIMGIETQTMEVRDWNWSPHISKSSGKEMLKVTYYGGLTQAPINEYIPVTHGGMAGEIAIKKIATIARQSGAVNAMASEDIKALAQNLSSSNPPTEIGYKNDGKFYRVITRTWSKADTGGGVFEYAAR